MRKNCRINLQCNIFTLKMLSPKICLLLGILTRLPNAVKNSYSSELNRYLRIILSLFFLLYVKTLNGREVVNQSNWDGSVCKQRCIIFLLKATHSGELDTNNLDQEMEIWSRIRKARTTFNLMKWFLRNITYLNINTY